MKKQRAHFSTLREALRSFETQYAALFSSREGTVSTAHTTRGEESVRITHDAVAAMNKETLQQFTEDYFSILRLLKPWRKGPFTIFNTEIHAEWRSDIKWQRLCATYDIAALCKGKRICDVGANTMYYAFRALMEGAKGVLAIEPLCRYYWYHRFFSMLFSRLPLYFEMIGAPLHESFCTLFDTIFCMGILYHQRNPLLCLRSLWRALKKGGVLVVETICINSHDDICLFPQSTYQCSSGYWFIPSLSVVKHWLTRCNFEIVAFDTPVLTTEREQRRTEWIDTHTLRDFLDPNDTSKTVEGYDAPHRVIVVARKKG